MLHKASPRVCKASPDVHKVGPGVHNASPGTHKSAGTVMLHIAEKMWTRKHEQWQSGKNVPEHGNTQMLGICAGWESA